MPTQVTDHDPRRIEGLNTRIARMAGLAEAQLAATCDALHRRDPILGRRIHADDHLLDRCEQEIEQAATNLLVQQHQTHTTVQEILGALRIAGELERIGDYAANIARRLVTLSGGTGGGLSILPRTGTLNRMGRLVQKLLEDVINAYTQRDLDRALDAWERDGELDDLYTSLYRDILAAMAEDPGNVTAYTHLMFIAKNFERIGDHATNIAEIIHILIAGVPMPGTRPKADQTPNIMVQEFD